MGTDRKITIRSMIIGRDISRESQNKIITRLITISQRILNATDNTTLDQCTRSEQWLHAIKDLYLQEKEKDTSDKVFNQDLCLRVTTDLLHQGKIKGEATSFSAKNS